MVTIFAKLTQKEIPRKSVLGELMFDLENKGAKIIKTCSVKAIL